MIKSRELKTSDKEDWTARRIEEMFIEMRSCWFGLAVELMLWN